jgi:MarR family 2-MHQ and catechol resistance regulon transcriptional repressor
MSRTIQFLTHAVLSARNAMLGEADRLFRPFGISSTHFNVLNLLIDEPRGLRPSALTQSLVVDPSSTTYLLDRMERRDWLRRTDDPDDRRACRIVLTPTGRRLHAEVFPAYKKAQAHLEHALNIKNQEDLFRVLEQLPNAAAAAVDHAVQEVSMQGDSAIRVKSKGRKRG